MALSFKDPETDALAREVARLTGETLTQAVKRSLAERLLREQRKDGDRRSLKERLQTIVDHYQSLPILDDRSPDEIIGYNEHGHFD